LNAEGVNPKDGGIIQALNLESQELALEFREQKLRNASRR
jgi:hypothetical protein